MGPYAGSDDNDFVSPGIARADRAAGSMFRLQEWPRGKPRNQGPKDPSGGSTGVTSVSQRWDARPFVSAFRPRKLIRWPSYSAQRKGGDAKTCI